MELFQQIACQVNEHFQTQTSVIKTVLSFESADKIIESDDYTKAFRHEAIINCKNNNYSSLASVAALSYVTDHCIDLIYTPKMNTKLFLLFTRKFNQEAMSTITLILTTTEDINTYTRPNHFSALIDSAEILQIEKSTHKKSGKRKISDWLPKIQKVENLSSTSDSIILNNDPSLFPSSSSSFNLSYSSTCDNTFKDSSLDNASVNMKISDWLPKIQKVENSQPASNPIIPNNDPSLFPVSSTCHNTTKEKNASANMIKSNQCKRSCCTGVPIPRGQPVKPANECDPYDIGLHFKNAASLPNNEKYDLLRRIWKPPSNFEFPQHMEWKRHWRFNSDYIDERSDKYLPWLAYSAHYDGTFCIPCVFFGCNFGSSKLVKLWKEPFTRWNGASKRWQEHENAKVTNIHSSSFLQLQTFMQQMEGKQQEINVAVNKAMAKQISENRKKLIPILKTVVVCGRQNFPLREHRVAPDDDSVNCGNFRALLDYRIDGGDLILKEHFDSAPKNATYQSPIIQNEMINCCRIYIQSIFLEKIRGKYFAIIADEASDSSNQEQLALVLRFIDDSGEIREIFMEFLHCPSLKGCDIANLILDTITVKYKLDMNLCVAQCYDGASNMSGVRAGVASLISARYPNALYFHCASHRLNLVVASSCQTCEEQSIRNMLDSIKKTSDIFKHSAKKEFLFGRTISEELPTETRRKLMDVCRTRWILRLDGMQRFQEFLSPIITTLDRINKNWDKSYERDAKIIAGGLKTNIEKFDFIIALVIVRHVLAYIQPLTYELQQVKLDIGAVYEAVDNNLTTLKKVRENIEIKHKEWYEHAVKLSNKLNIPVKAYRVTGIQINRSNYESNSVEEFYRRSITAVLLDGMISQLQDRFSEAHRLHSHSFSVIPIRVVSDKFWKARITNKENKDCFTQLYGHLLPSSSALSEEMDLWETYWHDTFKKKGTVPDNIRDALCLSVGKKNWFPNMITILEIVGTVPSSSNSCERSISKLRLIKTYLRTTMAQDRLNGLTLLYTHREINIDYDKLLDIFARQYPHRLRLI